MTSYTTISLKDSLVSSKAGKHYHLPKASNMILSHLNLIHIHNRHSCNIYFNIILKISLMSHIYQEVPPTKILYTILLSSTKQRVWVPLTSFTWFFSEYQVSNDHCSATHSIPNLLYLSYIIISSKAFYFQTLPIYVLPSNYQKWAGWCNGTQLIFVFKRKQFQILPELLAEDFNVFLSCLKIMLGQYPETDHKYNLSHYLCPYSWP
jgi:hypothetical protein